jgi:hypothetical protein
MKDKKLKGPGGEAAIAAMERSGLSKLRWVVIKELEHLLIIKHRLTGEVKVIDK